MASLTFILINFTQTLRLFCTRQLTSRAQTPSSPGPFNWGSPVSSRHNWSDVCFFFFLILWKCLNEIWHDGHIKESKGGWWKGGWLIEVHWRGMMKPAKPKGYTMKGTSRWDKGQVRTSITLIYTTRTAELPRQLHISNSQLTCPLTLSDFMWFTHAPK